MQHQLIGRSSTTVTAVAVCICVALLGRVLGDDGQLIEGREGQQGAQSHPELESLVRPLLRGQWTDQEIEQQAVQIEKRAAYDALFRSQLAQVAQAFIKTDTLNTIPTVGVRTRIRAWAKLSKSAPQDLRERRPSTSRIPSDTWMQYRDVEQAGFDGARIDDVRKHLAASNIDGLIVICDGAVLLRHGDIETRFMCHSVRKSFMSMLYGIYEAQGKIDLTKTLAELNIDDIEPRLTEEERQATIADLLKSRSGVYHKSAYEPPHMKNTRPERGSHAPGTHWWYNNWDFNALLTIFEQETGEKFFEAFQKYIAKPLQLQDFRLRDGYYHLESQNSTHPAYPFRLSGRDMARIGLVMGRQGRWGERQVVPSAWVKESTREHSTISKWQGYSDYGYMWWIARSPQDYVFSALGNGNNSIDVMPDRNLVFVFRANTFEGKNISVSDRWQIMQGVMRAQTGTPVDNPVLVPLKNESNLPQAVALSADYLSQFPLDLRRQLPQHLPAEVRDQPVRIEEASGTLVLHTAPPPALQFDLIPLAEDRFFLEGPNQIGVIDRDENGHSTRFLLKGDLVAWISELEKAGRADDALEAEELAKRLFGYQKQTRSTVIAESIRKLVEMQIQGAPWTYEGNYRREDGIPVTYQVGGTALVSLALLYGAGKDDAEAQTAWRAGLRFVLKQIDHPMMEAARSNEYDMRVLAQAYSLLFLRHVQLKEAAGDLDNDIDAAITTLTQALVFEQMRDGGWNYQDRPVHASFVTASVVQALLWVRPVSNAVTDAVLSRAAAVLASSRYSDGGYLYFGTRESKPKRDMQDQLPGSIARGAICETILSLLGKGSSDRLQHAVESFHRHWHQLEARRGKPGTHAGPYMIAPYYYYYGHRYAAQAIELLPDSQRPAQRRRMYELLMRTRDSDGLWNDRDFSRSRSYSTAMVLLALMSEDVGLPPAWPGPQEGTPVTSLVPNTKDMANAFAQRSEKYRSDASKVMMKNVYVVSPEGKVRNVTPTPGEGFYGGGCIHPEGRDVIFPGAAKGYSRIWRYDLATDKVAPLTADTCASINPSYSADGKHIVFVSDQDFDNPRFDMFEVGRGRSHNEGFSGGMTSFSSLYVMDADGTNIQRLTSGDHYDRRPSFSPDGRAIVFLSNRGSSTLHLWTVPSDGSMPPTKLEMSGNPWAGRPRHSIDGTEIFFFTGITDGEYSPKGRHTLCRVPIGGGAWQVVSNDTLGDSSHGPDPDPDGKHLWYHAAINNVWSLCKLPLSGGDPVQFIPPGFEKHHVAHPTVSRNGYLSFDSRSHVTAQ